MLDQITPANVWLFVFLVLPGFVPMRVYGLLRPMERITLRDSILEAVAFSITNVALMFWAVTMIIDPTFYIAHKIWSYVLFALTFFVAPVVWPFLLHLLIGVLEDKGIILSQQPTSWDHFFRRRQGGQGCWIVVHLKDGRRLGGKFGRLSYASAYPNPGHLYIEELWALDAEGTFLKSVPNSWGVILRPNDYHMIEMYS